MINRNGHQQRIGFIGTGIMGSGMARNLIRTGYDVHVYNRTRSKAEAVTHSGGTVADCPADAARDADVIITMLSDPEALLGVVTGVQGILETIQPGTILIDSSTVSPPTSLEVLQRLQEKEAMMLDAPVFGSKNEAEKGELGFLVGGDAEVLERVQDIFDCLGRVRHIGGNGRGASAKLVLNLIMAGTLQVFNEGMVLGTKAGIDPKVMLELILSSRARSGIIEMKAPQILNRNFTPFFPLHLMAKDMRLVRESAAELGMQLPIAETLNAVYSGCLNAGLANEDFAATVKLLEQQAELEVKLQPSPAPCPVP